MSPLRSSEETGKATLRHGPAPGLAPASMLRLFGRIRTQLLRRAFSNGGTISQQGSTKFKFPIGKSLAVSGLTAVGLWCYFRLEKAKLAKKAEPVEGALGKPKVGGPFTLINQDGKEFSYPQDLNGAYSLIYFGFTHCPDICPEELEKISEVLNIIDKNQPPKKLVPIFITCDPERDSPAAIKEYLGDFHPSFIGVTGPMDQVKEAAKLFRVYFKAAKTSNGKDGDKDYLVDHTIFYYLMDPEGRYVTHFGRDHWPADVAKTILEYLNQ